LLCCHRWVEDKIKLPIGPVHRFLPDKCFSAEEIEFFGIVVVPAVDVITAVVTFALAELQPYPYASMFDQNTGYYRGNRQTQYSSPDSNKLSKLALSLLF
jgi:hypothetical protein